MRFLNEDTQTWNDDPPSTVTWYTVEHIGPGFSYPVGWVITPRFSFWVDECGHELTQEAANRCEIARNVYEGYEVAL